MILNNFIRALKKLFCLSEKKERATNLEGNGIEEPISVNEKRFDKIEKDETISNKAENSEKIIAETIPAVEAMAVQSEKKEWLITLVKNIENQKNENKSIPFKIVDIKNHGFIVKVSGLFAFIPFNHMPWQYGDNDFWKAIFPKLNDKVFFCRIYLFTANPLSIIIDGKIPQFKTIELTVGCEYTGIVLKKSDYGVFIDVGYYFSWKCGSFVGRIAKTQFADSKSFSDCVTGQEITATFLRKNEKEQLVFSNNKLDIDWEIDKPQQLVGQIVWVQVVRNTEKSEIHFLTKGKYKSTMNISNLEYSTKQILKIKQAKEKLSNGDIINCEITKSNDKKKLLQLKWIIEIDTEIVMDNSIINNLDSETIQKLTSLKNELYYNKQVNDYGLST